MEIILTFTYKTSLKVWEDTGLLTREMLFYKKLADKYQINFTFITYGDNYDLRFENYFQNLKIIPIYKYIKKSKFEFINFIRTIYFPLIIKKEIKNIDLIKTNQLMGSWIGIMLKIIYSKPLLLRTGFDKVSFLIKERKSKLTIILAYVLTQISLIFSSVYFVTSKEDYKYMNKVYFFGRKKIKIRPNWVAEVERSELNSRPNNKILLVGRLESQKNYEYVINSFENSNFELDIVGTGTQLNRLEQLSLEKNVSVNFLGSIPNSELINKYKEYKFFLIASTYEGNSKVLLEAMSAGCVVIARNISNNSELITNEDNGYLFNDGENLPEFIREVNKDKTKLESISSSAIKSIQDNYSINKILEEEYNTFKGVINIS